MNDSFGSRASLKVGGREIRIARLDALERRVDVGAAPTELRATERQAG